MVTSTWLVRRRRPEQSSSSRTTALLLFPTPQTWRKSQIPCPRNGPQGACANSASVGFIPAVSVLLSTRKEQKRSTFRYQYSVFQIEYSRNLLFQSGRQMDQIFQALIDRTRGPLDLDRIKTIFGDKKRPHYDRRKRNPTRWGVVIETPAYDLTVFKVHYGKMTLKIYTKGERVLRIEVIVHNTKRYRWGRSLPCFPEIV